MSNENQLRVRSRLKFRSIALPIAIVFLCISTALFAKTNPDNLTPLGDSFAHVISDMVPIPAGSFLMGHNAKQAQEWEKPAHKITLKRFRLSKYLVTIAQYDSFTEATGRKLIDDEGWGRGQKPAIYVSWADSQNFIEWLNRTTKLRFRLPTEAEWEYAARAGTRTDYPWGNADDPRQRNGALNVKETSIVGKFPPNAWGLYDMIGNVWQWTQDCWHDNYIGAPKNGAAWSEHCAQGHVHRGGSWDNDSPWLRVTARGREDEGIVHNGMGFRLALD